MSPDHVCQCLYAFCFCFNAQSYSEAQAGLELIMSPKLTSTYSNPSASASKVLELPASATVLS